ncbi:radical SAM protein [Desulforhopalus singaporensis]|uniref:Radical SAM superfamily enzyme, MoaA/NifB/PqqE/SkfB family n=1 Tax=Desulforhopalus singaporensis TaxID=91360 RepID=A0A1H0QNS5_9BACT|nr:radical SAM protein [Desulforhopalus singaporensis]SDP19023.1 Radical SAM superfamily enzyme, MoaA/NifB/PqqE/SkfB family [Desulforhopalus singaporensis]
MKNKELHVSPKKAKSQARTVAFRSGERNVFFHILTGCNLACKHCYINREQHGTGQLGIDEIEEWLKIFVAPGKKTNLIILGGEPTLHPDLSRAIRSAKKLGYDVTVDSNGYLFHDLLEKVTPSELDFLSFSLDGPDPQVNDDIRGEGVFDTCVANIKKAVKNGFNVSVIYTVSRKNINHLHRMTELLTELEVNKFFIQVLGLRGNSAISEGEEVSQVAREEWLAVVPRVAEEAAAAGIHVTFPKVFLEEGEVFECAGNVAENYFIFPNGRVYKCPLCEDHPIHSYEICDNRLTALNGLTESSFFQLEIAEGCVMNKLLQPDTIEYDDDHNPVYRISCCLLKQEIKG